MMNVCLLHTEVTSAPLLNRPDPRKQFIVEDDASDTGSSSLPCSALWQISPPRLLLVVSKLQTMTYSLKVETLAQQRRSPTPTSAAA